MKTFGMQRRLKAESVSGSLLKTVNVLRIGRYICNTSISIRFTRCWTWLKPMAFFSYES
jgi:hypothetical protein